MNTYVVVDVEAKWLYGRSIAAVALVFDDGQLIDQFVARCAIWGRVDPWVRRNVLPAMANIPVTHLTRRGMLEDFYQFCEGRTRGKDTHVLAFNPYPVESGFLAAIFRKKGRCFEGPFPLLDLGSMLHFNGYDPTDLEGYLKDHDLEVPFDGSVHHPVYDAWATWTAFCHLRMP